MDQTRDAVVFFDLGDTLASARLNPAGDRLISLDVYPYARTVLEELSAAGLRLGIISNTGQETAADMQRLLTAGGIYERFDPALLIYSSEVGLTKNSPAIFELAARRAGAGDTPARCLYVGEDALERRFAREAGMCPVPHPLLVREVLAGQRLRYLRVHLAANQDRQTWGETLSAEGLVPMYVDGEGGGAVWGIASTRTMLVFADRGLTVDALGGEDLPLETDVYLLRDHRSPAAGFMDQAGQAAGLLAAPDRDAIVLAANARALYVALPAGDSIDRYHFGGARHGHTVKLLPSPTLLDPATVPAAAAMLTEAAEPALSPAELTVLGTIDAAGLREQVRRYSGDVPLRPNLDRRIRSRHIEHPDNSLAVLELASDLADVGGGAYRVLLHRFTDGVRPLMNVEATLDGESPELVLVTAHLDSTAKGQPPFTASQDPAPGADDDASGVAAVLITARVLAQLAGQRRPKRSLRLVLFNAEEVGLVGSEKYAADQKKIGAAIAGVYQMDMIGYNSAPPPTCEVHAGYSPNPVVEEASVQLATRLQRMAVIVSPGLREPQLYRSPEDRDKAEGRSDHTSFHANGYAACVLSEDFFAGPSADAPQDSNPHYHRRTDTVAQIDFEFAANLARAVTAAAWVTANV